MPHQLKFLLRLGLVLLGLNSCSNQSESITDVQPKLQKVGSIENCSFFNPYVPNSVYSYIWFGQRKNAPGDIEGKCVEYGENITIAVGSLGGNWVYDRLGNNALVHDHLFFVNDFSIYITDIAEDEYSLHITGELEDIGQHTEFFWRNVDDSVWNVAVNNVLYRINTTDFSVKKTLFDSRTIDFALYKGNLISLDDQCNIHILDSEDEYVKNIQANCLESEPYELHLSVVGDTLIVVLPNQSDLAREVVLFDLASRRILASKTISSPTTSRVVALGDSKLAFLVDSRDIIEFGLEGGNFFTSLVVVDGETLETIDVVEADGAVNLGMFVDNEQIYVNVPDDDRVDIYAYK